MTLLRDDINVQQFELLEERLGISIKGLTARMSTCHREETDPERKIFITVNAEVIATSGGEIDQNFQLQLVISDSNGNVLGTEIQYYWQPTFFGLDVFSVYVEIFKMDVCTLKLFPKRS
jgi:hypothetical protein